MITAPIPSMTYGATRLPLVQPPRPGTDFHTMQNRNAVEIRGIASSVIAFRGPGRPGLLRLRDHTLLPVRPVPG